MKIEQLLTEEMRRFEAFYGRKPDNAYLGTKQAEELHEMVSVLGRFGMLVNDKAFLGKRPEYRGMKIFVVDAESHLSFGWENMSPCS